MKRNRNQGIAPAGTDLRSLRDALELAQHGKQQAEQYAAEWKRLAEAEPTKVELFALTDALDAAQAECTEWKRLAESEPTKAEMFAMRDALNAAQAECSDAKLRLQHLREELEHTAWRGFGPQPMPPLPLALGKAEEELRYWQERALKAERQRDAHKLASLQAGFTAADAFVLWDTARDRPSRRNDGANIHEVRLRGSKPRREASLHVRGPLDPED